MRRITSSMSNGSFGPFEMTFVFATRVLVALDLVSPRARRIAMTARGGKNDARDYAALDSRSRRFVAGCT
jgi:hypothetical protein